MVFIFTSCNLIDTRRGDDRVARVNDKHLYKSDLAELVTPGTNPSDSAVIVKRYIENWIRQQVYLQEAENNLSSEKLDFESKIQNYRNSLVVFTYENELIAQELDTVITEEVMKEYYENHQDEFRLRDNIVQVNFVKLPIDAPDINQIRSLIRSEEPEDLEELEEYCLNHAAGYFLDQESWFIFTDVLREVPLNPSNHATYLRNNKFVELNDQYYRYFLYIRDYELEGSPSPLTFQADNIKAIILNHRKQELVNDFRQRVYRDAVKNNAFEIF